MDVKTIDVLFQSLGDAVGYILVGAMVICVSKAKDWFSVRTLRRSTRKAVRNSVQLSAFLGEVRAFTESDRLLVMQFHNGDHFASGASVQKISLTHAILRPGVSMPTNLGGETLVTFPATFMTHLLDEIFANGYGIYSTAPEREPKDNWVQRYQAVNGVATEVICLIPGISPKDAFGLLCFSWLEDHPLTSECINALLAYAKRTSARL